MFLLIFLLAKQKFGWWIAENRMATRTNTTKRSENLSFLHAHTHTHKYYRCVGWFQIIKIQATNRALHTFFFPDEQQQQKKQHFHNGTLSSQMNNDSRKLVTIVPSIQCNEFMVHREVTAILTVNTHESFMKVCSVDVYISDYASSCSTYAVRQLRWGYLLNMFFFLSLVHAANAQNPANACGLKTHCDSFCVCVTYFQKWKRFCEGVSSVVKREPGLHQNTNHHIIQIDSNNLLFEILMEDQNPRKKHTRNYKQLSYSYLWWLKQNCKHCSWFCKWKWRNYAYREGTVLILENRNPFTLYRLFVVRCLIVSVAKKKYIHLYGSL